MNPNDFKPCVAFLKFLIKHLKKSQTSHVIYILHNQKHEPDYAYKNTQGNNPIANRQEDDSPVKFTREQFTNSIISKALNRSNIIITSIKTLKN